MAGIEEVIGTARLDIVVNSDTFDAAIARGKSGAQQLSNSAQQAFQQADAVAKRSTTNLQRYAELIGKSADEVQLLRAAWNGVDKGTINEMASLIQRSREETQKATVAARERAQAEREVAAAIASEQANDAAMSASYERELAATNQVHRRADAVYALSQLLDQQEQHERDLAAIQASNAARAQAANNAITQGLMRERAELEAVSAARERDLAAIQASNAARAQAANNAITQGLMRERAELEAVSAARERDLAAIQASNAARAQAANNAITQGLMRERAELEAVSATRNNFILDLQRQAQTVGKTRSELLELRAAELGVAQDAAPFINALKKQETQLVRSGVQFNQYGLSTKQTAAALRQVPAQLTDIFVSLQGGQRPLTVLLQQGGQLKDIFGGIRPAAEALGSALLKLVSAETLTLAGIGLLSYAWYQAEKRSEALNTSLITTGRYTDVTKQKFVELAQQLDSMRGVTEGSANEAIAMAAQTGRIPIDMMEDVTRAALAMREATGKAVKETISEFAEFGRDPVQAVLKFNEAEHFLTREVLDQIQALQDQGNIAEAARVAMDARAQAMIQNADDVNAHLGPISTTLHAIRNGVPDVWDWMVSGLQRVDDKAGEAWHSLKNMFSSFSIGGPASAFAMVAASQGADFNGTPKPEDPASTVDSEAARRFKSFQDSNLSRQERQKREVEQIKETGRLAKAAQADIDKAVKDSEDRYNESLKKPKSTSALDNAVANAALQAFKDRLAEQQGLLQNHTQILQAKYSAGIVSEADYYKESRQIVEDDTSAQVTAIQSQIEYLEKRNVKGKEAADVQRQLGQLEAQLAKVRADGATKLAILTIQEDDSARKRRESLEDYKVALQQSNDALKLQNAASVLRVTMGQKEAEQAGKVADAYASLSVEVARLSLLKQREDDPAKKLQYDDEIEAARIATEEKVKIIKDGYEEMAVAQGDWINGVRASWMDFITQTNDVAGQVSSITTNILQGAASSITEMFTKGRTDVRAFLADIGEQLTKFFVQRAVMQFAAMFLSGWLGGGTSTPSASGAASFGNNTGWLSNGSFGGNGGAGFSLNAHGNMFAGGTGLANQVVNKPTFFAFAKGGAVGVAGEGKKPEAIMPLMRGPNGDLGVQMFGGGASSGVTLNVTTIVNSDGSATSKVDSNGGAEAYKRVTESMRVVAQQEVQRMMRPGGELYKAGVGRR